MLNAPIGRGVPSALPFIFTWICQIRVFQILKSQYLLKLDTPFPGKEVKVP